MQQTECLVFNPITVDNFPSLFNCTQVGRAWTRQKSLSFSLVGTGPQLVSLLNLSGLTWCFSFAPVFQWCCITPRYLQTLFCRVPMSDLSKVLPVMSLFAVMIH